MQLNRSAFVLWGALVAALLLLLPCCTGMAGENRKTPSSAMMEGIADGVYEGSAQGFRGEIYLSARVEGGSLAEIEILDSSEDPFVGQAAIEELLDLVLMYNTTDLDAISGATISSEGFLSALNAALEQGRHRSR